MGHWRVPYLGLRQKPSDLTTFELDVFFTFSPKEIELIDSWRSDLYRRAHALHIGFVRMAGRTLDAYKQIAGDVRLSFSRVRASDSADQHSSACYWHLKSVNGHIPKLVSLNAVSKAGRGVDSKLLIQWDYLENASRKPA